MAALTQAKTLLVKDICEQEWEAHKADCSGFVKAVAQRLGVVLNGQANDIMRYLRLNSNSSERQGMQRKRQRRDGWSLLASKPTRTGIWPLSCLVRSIVENTRLLIGAGWVVPEINQTINWSLSQPDIDRVAYHYISHGDGLVSGGMPNRIIRWGVDNVNKRSIAF